jgi:hypothetical protein
MRFAAHDLALNATARLKAKNVTLNVYQYFIEMKIKLANRLTRYQIMVYCILACEPRDSFKTPSCSSRKPGQPPPGQSRSGSVEFRGI